MPRFPLTGTVHLVALFAKELARSCESQLDFLTRKDDEKIASSRGAELQRSDVAIHGDDDGRCGLLRVTRLSAQAGKDGRWWFMSSVGVFANPVKATHTDFHAIPLFCCYAIQVAYNQKILVLCLGCVIMVSMQDETLSQRSGSSKSLLGIGLALILATSAFFSGVHIGSFTNPNYQSASLFSFFSNPPATSATDKADLSEFWKVWDLMDEKFAIASSSVPLSSEEKVRGAIAGLVQAFNDPYTTYLPPNEASYFSEDISGNFSGVGMEVGMRNSMITIISPLPGTPAEKSGLLAGDIIVAINGTSTEGFGVDTAVRLIRGEEGTVVTLSILREGEHELKKIEVTRAKIEIPTVKTEKRGDIFIITLYSFNAISEAKMQTALREYVNNGAKKLVLDMRGNPGGFLQSAVAIASYIMPAGEVVLRENFGDSRDEQIYRSKGKIVKRFVTDEIVVLIDGGSASAAEILAGALGQHGYATIIGQNSFGKGSVQELVDLESGAALKVTIARWLTPDGTSISNGGIAPDISVERTSEQRLANEDPQLQTAIDFLHGTYQPSVSTSTTNISQ